MIDADGMDLVRAERALQSNDPETARTLFQRLMAELVNEEDIDDEATAALLHTAILRGDFTQHRDRRAEHRRAFKLRLHAIGRHHFAGVHHCPDVGDPQAAVLVHHHFHHRCHVGEEAAVYGHAEVLLLVSPLMRTRDHIHAPVICLSIIQSDPGGDLGILGLEGRPEG